MPSNKRKILLLPGDGIGPEVVSETKKVIEWFNKKKSLDFNLDEGLIGGAAIHKHGVPINDEVLYKYFSKNLLVYSSKMSSPLSFLDSFLN